MSTLLRTALLLALLPVLVFADGKEHRSFIGGCTPPANTNWEYSANWSPSGVPTAASSVTIAYSSPYVAITAPIAAALNLTIQSGGKLVLRKSDGGRALGVLSTFTVDDGGSFVGVGGSGTDGPVVAIGGDITNHGTWDLTGIATAYPAVVLFGCKSQRISGSRMLVFENLFSANGFIVDGVDVYVVGKYTGPWPEEVNNGHFIVGEHPLPITLAYFGVAFDNRSNNVNLTWRTVSEINNYGFYVERRPATSDSYEMISFVPTQGNGLTPHEYSLNDAAVPAGSWYYRLRQVDLDGTESSTEGVLVEITSVTSVENETAPVAFGLAQNYPNPFNPSTRIRFSVEVAGTARVKVYDTVGREVALLFDGAVESGRYYSVSFDGAGLSSGTYFYRLESGSKVEMKKMVLMK